MVFDEPSTLEYSEYQDCFHVDMVGYHMDSRQWHTLAQSIPESKALLFIELMEKKYCKNGNPQRFPPLGIIKTEFELFNKLDSYCYRRKLSNYFR
jgi:hypothetical protein